MFFILNLAGALPMQMRRRPHQLPHQSESGRNRRAFIRRHIYPLFAQISKNQNKKLLGEKFADTFVCLSVCLFVSVYVRLSICKSVCLFLFVNAIVP